MNRIILFFLFLSGLIINLSGQTINLKEEAIKVSETGNYSKAIQLLEKAKIENPKDPEIYYYLGVFMHYLAYDSTPLSGYDSTYTDKVLPNFEKTIELNPNYGDAYYFMGSQYSGEAIDAMQNGDGEKYKAAFKKAYDAGAFPKWLVEYDRNILKSCDTNAILFVGGDSEFNPIQYLQVVENFRQDITAIPFGLLDRPWYVEVLEKGFSGILRKAPLSISKKQIMDMHPYKWDKLIVNISISDKMKKEFKLPSSEVMKWKIVPDLTSDDGTFLSTKRAILFNIIQANKWDRPVYFSLGIWTSFYDGLEKYFQLSGLTHKLLPIITDKTKYTINASKVEEVLLDKNNIKNFYDVEKHNIPKISGMLVNYYVDLYQLAIYYKEKEKFEEIKGLIKFIKNNLTTDAFHYDWNIIQMLEKLLNK